MQKLKIKSRKTIHDSKTRVRWSITIQKPRIIDISIFEEIFSIIWYIPTHLISNLFYLNNIYDTRQKFSNKIQQKLKIRSRKNYIRFKNSNTLFDNDPKTLCTWHKYFRRNILLLFGTYLLI